jgi:hypothetical protein
MAVSTVLIQTMPNVMAPAWAIAAVAMAFIEVETRSDCCTAKRDQDCLGIDADDSDIAEEKRNQCAEIAARTGPLGATVEVGTGQGRNLKSYRRSAVMNTRRFVSLSSVPRANSASKTLKAVSPVSATKRSFSERRASYVARRRSAQPEVSS